MKDEALLKSAIYEVKISIPKEGIEVDEKNISYEKTMAIINKLLADHPKEKCPKLHEMWERHQPNFGFMGASDHGDQFSIGASRERIPTNEKQTMIQAESLLWWLSWPNCPKAP